MADEEEKFQIERARRIAELTGGRPPRNETSNSANTVGQQRNETDDENM